MANLRNSPQLERIHSFQVPAELAHILRKMAQENDRPLSKEIVRLIRLGLEIDGKQKRSVRDHAKEVSVPDLINLVDMASL